MANHKSAIKRIRQIDRRTKVNREGRGRMRTQLKKFVTAADAGDKEALGGLLGPTMSALDVAVRKGLIKKGRADRLKSRLSVRANKIAKAE